MDSTSRIASFAPNAGLSLIELAVAILLSVVVMGAIYSVYRFQTHSLRVQEKRMEAQQYVRSVLDLMVREIRNAGYDPCKGGAVCTETNCAGMVVADDQTLQYRYDANANGDCADPDEDITYGFVTTGCQAGFGDITRKDGTNAAVSLTEDCGISDATIFTYFPKDCSNNFSTPVGGGSAACPATAGGDSGTEAAIQRIKITVTGHSKDTDAAFGGQLIATMTSSIELRNVGLPP